MSVQVLEYHECELRIVDGLFRLSREQVVLLVILRFHLVHLTLATTIRGRYVI